jgi:hypothetical protein
MASKRAFQFIFAAVSAFSAYRFTSALGALERRGFFPAGVVRLRILGLRGGGPPSTATLAVAGLLHDGCRLPSKVGTDLLWSNGTAVLGDWPANGYFFVTASGNAAADPVQWVVESSADNGSTWLPVGASVWRLASEGAYDLFPQLAYDSYNASRWNPYAVATATSAEAELDLVDPWAQSEVLGVEVRVDARPPLSWLLSSAFKKLAYALAFLSFTLFGIIGLVHRAKTMWVVLLAADLLLILAGSCIIAIEEQWLWREATKGWLYVGGVAALIGGSLWAENQFIAMFLVYSIVIILSESFTEIALYGRLWPQVLRGQATNLSVVAGAFSIFSLCFRHRALARARRLVIADCRSYDAIWKSFRANPATENALLAIRAQVLLLLKNNLKITETIPHQRAPAAVKWQEIRLIPGSIVLMRGAPVVSLDQLFVQAWCLNPVLLSKVQAWALGSRGCFPCISTSSAVSFVRYSDAVHEPGLPMRWATVKSTHRAIEKLVRVYGQVMSMTNLICTF